MKHTKLSGPSLLLKSQQLLEHNEDLIASIVENMQVERLDDCIKQYMMLQSNLLALSLELDSYPAAERDAYESVYKFPDSLMRRDVLDVLRPAGSISLPPPPPAPPCKECFIQQKTAHDCRVEMEHIGASSKYSAAELEEFVAATEILADHHHEHMLDAVRGKTKRQYKRWKDFEKYTLMVAISILGHKDAYKISEIMEDRSENQIRNYITKNFSTAELQELESGVLPPPPQNYQPPARLVPLFADPSRASLTSQGGQVISALSPASPESPVSWNTMMIIAADLSSAPEEIYNNAGAPRTTEMNDFSICGPTISPGESFDQFSYPVTVQTIPTSSYPQQISVQTTPSSSAGMYHPDCGATSAGGSSGYAQVPYSASAVTYPGGQHPLSAAVRPNSVLGPLSPATTIQSFTSQLNQEELNGVPTSISSQGSLVTRSGMGVDGIALPYGALHGLLHQSNSVSCAAQSTTDEVMASETAAAISLPVRARTATVKRVDHSSTSSSSPNEAPQRHSTSTLRNQEIEQRGYAAAAPSTVLLAEDRVASSTAEESHTIDGVMESSSASTSGDFSNYVAPEESNICFAFLEFSSVSQP